MATKSSTKAATVRRPGDLGSVSLSQGRAQKSKRPAAKQLSERSMPADTIVLDPNDEFESVLADMVSMHREKTKAYGARGDALQNFYNIAAAEGISPIAAAEYLAAKHKSVIREFVNGDQVHNKYSDDAFLDRAVYAVLSLILYRRAKG